MYEISEAAQARQHPTPKNCAERRGRTIKEHLAALTPSEAALLEAIWHVNDANYPHARFLPMRRAMRIVEKREPWPKSPAVRAWKFYKELLYFQGVRDHPEPPWVSESNTRPPKSPTLGELRLVGAELRFFRRRR